MKRFYFLLLLLLCSANGFTQSRLNLAISQFTKTNTNLNQQDLSGLIEKDGHVSSISNIHHSYYTQTHNGIEVFGSTASLHTNQSGKVVKVNNDLIEGVSSKVSGTAALSAIQAVQSMAVEMGYKTSGKITVVSGSQSKAKDQQVTLSPGTIAIENIPAKLIYYPLTNGTLRLVWEMVIHEHNQENVWQFFVDATTGTIVDKYNLVIHCKFGDHNHTHENDCSSSEHKTNNKSSLDFQGILSHTPATNSFAGGYMVFPMPIESPYYGSRSMVTNPEDPTYSPYGWHDINGQPGSEFTDTRGNNVDAYEDGNNSGHRASGGSNLQFNFPFSTNYSTGNQSEDAAITNLFYWNNVIHDVLGHYGFDAPAGNFQKNNYGQGGNENDDVRAEAQDGSGTCNANMYTPADGSRPRMQMYVCGSKDGDFDNLVIVHEYGHGISKRLTGGKSTTNCLTFQEQQGEGISDFYGLIFTMDASNTPTTKRSVGNYLFGKGANGNGIRPKPYTTVMSGAGSNNSTYNTIKTAAIPHGVGYVWGTMLWEMTWEIIAITPFDPDIYQGNGGNNIAMKLVTEGLKLQPCQPGFVDARDAILAADQAMYNGAYQCAIWTAFAKRGLGENANQGSASSRTDGTEDFTVPAIACPTCTLSISPTTFIESATAGNKTIQVSASSGENWTAATSDNWITLNSTSGTGNGSLDFTLTNNTSNVTRTGTITITCGGSSIEEVTIYQAGNIPPCTQQYASLPYATGFESGQFDQYWCIATENAIGRVRVTDTSTPNNGTYHLTFDCLAKSIYSTNEAKLGLQLQGKSNARLKFAWREFGDESHAEDGVFFSDDGGATYVKAYDFQNGPQSYTQVDLSMDSLTSVLGLSLTDQFVIKFQQRDNYPMTSDGIGVDDVTVKQYCNLSVSPSVITATETGSNQTVQITASMGWTATTSENWITLNTTSGTGNSLLGFNIANNTSNIVRIGKINLTCGSFTDQVTIYQAANIPNCNQQYSTLPYSTGFESGQFDQYWCSAAENAVGRVRVTDINTPNNGNYHLTFDCLGPNVFSTNEATLGLKLLGKSNARLQFSWREFSDENHVEDGVFFSDDGGATYAKAFDFQNGPQSYTAVDLSIDSLTTALGLTLTDQFIVKFQQRDNSSMTTDGIGVDDVLVFQPCNLSISPLFSYFPADGATDSIVTVTGNINWTATTADSWITIKNGSGNGNGTFTYDVAANALTTQRTGYITISCGLESHQIEILQEQNFPQPPCSLQFATLPYTTGFENGLDQYWCTNTSNSNGNVRVTGIESPYNGVKHLAMDVHVAGQLSTNEAILGLNLFGQSNVTLSFFYKDIQENYHPEDGIYFSDDGGASYVKVLLLNTTASVYHQKILDVDALAAANNLQLNSKFLIKFQQRDNNPIPDDGFVFDDVKVFTGSSCVRQYTTLPYSTGFENGLDQYWCINKSTPNGNVRITKDQIPYHGSKHLAMDVVVNGQYSTNEATLGLNLSNQSNVTVSFYHKNLDDEQHSQDGIYFSDDGGSTYVKVYYLKKHNSINPYKNVKLNVDSLAAINNLQLNSTFVVKFQQRDNYPMPSDGFVFDDVKAYSGPLRCTQLQYATLPYSTGFESGLDQHWCLDQSHSNGNIEVITDHAPFAGVKHLSMDVLSKGSYSTNKATLGLNLSGQSNITLSFYHKNEKDEIHPEDGIFFSDDGGLTYVNVYPLIDSTGIYHQVVLDVDALATANNLQLNSTFLVKFQQRDNSPLPDDGFLFDEINVFTGSTTPTCNLTVNPASFLIQAYGATVQSTITTSDTWFSSTDGSNWLFVTVASGTGNGGVGVIVKPNTTGITRTGEVYVTCGLTIDTISFFQQAVGPGCSQYYTTLPYSTGFESGLLDQYWCTATSYSVGRVGVSSASVPSEGNYHLTFDCSSTSYSTNQATLGLDLQGQSGVRLKFAWREYGDENHIEDGLFLSDDGGTTYVKAYDFQNGPQYYTNADLSVDSLALALGLTLTDQFIIKFQQRDNFSMTTDGISVDEVAVFVASQYCNLSVSPLFPFFLVDGATDSVATITTGGSWTATTNNSWITIKNGSGIGNGTFTYDIAANPLAVQRLGYITVTCGAVSRQIEILQEKKVSPTTPCTQQYATLPYFTGFETGQLDQYWCTATENAAGRVRVTDVSTPSEGNYHLTFDCSTASTYSTNEATLGLNLQGQSAVRLKFAWREFGDESHIEDGVFLSDDGGVTYTKAYDFQNGPQSYTKVDLSIDSLALALGLTLSNQFIVKFQQRDNYPMTTDGIGVDEVSVFASTTNCNLTVSPLFPYILSGGVTDSTATVASTGSWTATTSDTWITIKNGSDTGNGTFTYDVAANPLTVQRLGYITVSCGSVTQQIEVLQEESTSPPTGCSQQFATIPYFTGFENGFDANWCTQSSNSFGRIQLTDLKNPHMGTYHMTMDVHSKKNYSINEAHMGIDLSGVNNAVLSFFWREFGDESHAEDGVFFSDDGGVSFVKVFDLINGTSTYQNVLLDIDSLANSHGLTLNSTFVINFQQYDNYPISTDGMAFDDISVTPGSNGTMIMGNIYHNPFATISQEGVYKMDEVAPNLITLSNRPNPFDQSTTIEFVLENQSTVSLEIIDITGKVIATPIIDETRDAGLHSVRFSAEDLAPGIYLYTLETNGYKTTKQMVVAR